MTIVYSPLYLPLFAWIFSLLGTWVALQLLRARRVMDTPNTRSNHTVPVPRGGGVAMIIAAILFMMAAGLPLYLCGLGLLLMLVSFADDVKSLPVSIRFGVQLAAVVIALLLLPGAVFSWLPHWLETAVLVLALLWYVNLTNFMDGIDGITSMQTIMTCIGICAVRIVHPSLPDMLALNAGILAAATFGFYVFNRSPAKLFMGDAGSIPLGFLTGILLILLARNGQLAAALILPAYYVSDASWTLLRRLLRGEKVWQAHSQHAYQQAVRSGLSHTAVVCRITALNMILVVLASLASTHMMWAIALVACAYLLTFCLIVQFRHDPAPR